MASTTNRSRMHVFADLKPYICTYESCPSALVTFSDRKSWAQHEFSCHRSDVVFKCDDCDRELTNEAAFSAHVEEYHVTKPSNTQLLALAAAAREIRHHPANEQLCPLCLQSGWQDERKFITHVARHMEDIALSAVPRNDDTDTEATNAKPPHDDSDKLSQGSNNSCNTGIFLDGNLISPSSPLGKVNALSSAFHTQWLTKCRQFIMNPPSDLKTRDLEYAKLSEGVMAHIVLKADIIETEGDTDARAARKQLVNETSDVLKRLDAVGKRQV
jgi:hypothetical protein